MRSADPLEIWREHWQARGWGDAALGLVAASSIIRAQQLVLVQADAALRPFGLTFARWEVLTVLDAFGEPVALSKIARALQMQAPSVTNAMNRLEQDRLVKRHPNPADGRGSLAVITDRGKQVVNLATEHLNSEVFVDLGLTTRELEETVRILAKFRATRGDF